MMSLYRTIKSTTGTYKRRRERSVGPVETFPREMVSRRKILSRSRDDLNLDQAYLQQQQEEEEDVWYNKDKLFKEHIQEVLDKWTQIDDEIWAKVIVFERNRRVAKAYARAPVLTINGSDDGFDGMRIGLTGFDNPMRDQKTEEARRHIGQGVKIKMDDAGNVLIRRYSKGNVYVKSTACQPNEETAIGNDIMKLPSQALEMEKIVKLFDMKKFQSNVNRELRRAYPDRRRLETQCLSAVAFVKSESDILDCPMWVLIVNVVAMDMLKSKLPPVQRLVDIKNRPRIPIPDEDPYSVAGNGGGSGGSSGSSGFGNGNAIVASPALVNGNGPITNGNGVAATREQLMMQAQQHAGRRSEKPPKLPPRDNMYPHDIPKPDYDDLEEESRIKGFARGKSDKGKDNKKYDDPYYCGLRARVPNFVKSSKKLSSKEQKAMEKEMHAAAVKKMSLAHLQHPNSIQSLHQMHSLHPHQQQLMAAHHHQQQMMWHARSYESGIGIYGKLSYTMQNVMTKSGSSVYGATTMRRVPRSRFCSAQAEADGYYGNIVAGASLLATDETFPNTDRRQLLTLQRHPPALPRTGSASTTPQIPPSLQTPPLPQMNNISTSTTNTAEGDDQTQTEIIVQTELTQIPCHTPNRITISSSTSPPCPPLTISVTNTDNPSRPNIPPSSISSSPILSPNANEPRREEEVEEEVEALHGQETNLTNETVTTFPFGHSTTTTPPQPPTIHDSVTDQPSTLSWLATSPTTMSINPTTTTATTTVTATVHQQPAHLISPPSSAQQQQQQPHHHPQLAQTMSAPLVAPAANFLQPLSLMMHPQQQHHQQQQQPQSHYLHHHPIYQVPPPPPHQTQQQPQMHFSPIGTGGALLGDGTVLQPQSATSMPHSPVYVRHLGPPQAVQVEMANTRRVSRAENDRKIYEQLYGVGGMNGRNNNNHIGTRKTSRCNPKEQEEIYSSEKTRKGAKSKSNKQQDTTNTDDHWPVEQFVVYPDYEPKYVSAMNLRERPTMAMHMQYQQQQVMPNHYDYYYYDRGYGPAMRPFDGHNMFPGVSQHGKWASDHDISGTLKRMKKAEGKASADDRAYGRKGEFRFNPALFNGQMFRNANMRYSTESGETSSGDDGEYDREEEARARRRAALIMKSRSDDSVDQFSLNVDDSALVNFMRANNEIVNHEFPGGDDRNAQGAVATRTTNIRYVTKVYVPRKLQQIQQEEEEEKRRLRKGQKKPSQIPQLRENGEVKKSVSTDSFFNELDKIDIDEEQNQYEMQKRCIEEHLELLKENTIMDYDSHDRKKLQRSNSHSTVMDGSGTKPKSKLPVNRRLSLMAKPDLAASRKMAEDMNSKPKLDASKSSNNISSGGGNKKDVDGKEQSSTLAVGPTAAEESSMAKTGNKPATSQ